MVGNNWVRADNTSAITLPRKITTSIEINIYVIY